MPKVKITNAAALQKEIIRLKKRSRALENELGDRVEYFRGNYGKMVLNTIIPGSGGHTGWLNIAGRVSKVAWKSSNAKSFATNALMTALEFVGVRLGINLFDKFRKSRSKKKKAKMAAQSADED
jgi:hypothetical protein